MLPDFITEVESVDSSLELDVVFDNFTLQIGREDLFKAAEYYLRERIPGSSPYTFVDLPGGMMGYIVGLALNAVVRMPYSGLAELLKSRLMTHFEFDADSLPPRLLAREAIALQIQLNKVTFDLGRMLGAELSSRIKMNARFISAADELSDPTDAYDLRDEVIDKILE